MTDHFEVLAERTFVDPVLVMALEGWVDAGLGAGAAIATLLVDTSAEPIVTFDSEHYVDQRARRPVVRIVDGITTELSWPTTQLQAGRDEAGRDVLFLVGPEPDFKWRDFIDDVMTLCTAHGVRTAIGLGAFPAPTPHTRPVRLAATAPATSAELVAKVGVVQGELEVPAGVTSALELAFGDAGMQTVTLWARVPHYVSAMPFPEASAALVEGLVSVAGLSFSTGALRSAADSSRRQVDELIADNPEHREMVRKLERSMDASEGNPFGTADLPSGDEIAEELEKFLRGEGQ